MASIADVYVTVLPETGKIAAGIKKALQSVDDDIKAATARWKKQIDDALKGIDLDVDTAKAEKKIDEVEKKKPKVTVDVEVDAAEIEKEVATKTRRRKPKVKAEVEADEESMSKLQQEAEALLSKLEIDLDETAKRNKIKKLQSDVTKALSKVGVTLQSHTAKADLEALRSETARLFSKIDLDFDSEAVDKLMEQFKGDIKVRFDADPERDMPGLFNAFSKLEFPTVDLELEAKKAEDELDGLINKVQSRLRKLLGARKLGIDVDLDIAEAQEELVELGAKRTVTVDVDTRIDEYLLQREIAESVDAGLEDAISKAEARIKRLITARKAGIDVEVEIADAVKELDELTAARTTTVDVEARINRDLLNRDLAESVDAGLEREISKTEEKIKKLLRGRKLGIDVGVDLAKATAELDHLVRQRTVNVDVDVDHDLLMAEINQITKVLEEGADGVASTFSSVFQNIIAGFTRIHPVIIAGLVPLGVAAGGILSSMTGALGMIPGLVTAAATAFGTLKLATQGFTDVLKDMGDPEKFSVGLRTLAPQAQQAALSIQSIMESAIKPLQTTLSETLFAGLGPQLINTVNAILPAVTPGMTAIAGAFNTMFQQIMGLFQDPEMVSIIGTMVDNIGAAFTAMAPGITLFVEAFTRIAAVGAGFLPGLATGLTNAAQAFTDFITKAQNSGDLAAWIQTGLDALGQLGPLIPSLMQLIGALIPIGVDVLPSFVRMTTSFVDMFAALLPITPLIREMPILFDILAVSMGSLAWLARGIADAFSWLWDRLQVVADVITAVVTVALGLLGDKLDELLPKPGAVYDAFAIAFPQIGAVVDGAATIVQAAVQKISDSLDGIIDKLNSFIDSINAIPLLTPFIDIPHIPKNGAPPGAAAKGGGAVGGPDAQGNIPGTNLPWTDQQPVGAGTLVGSGSGSPSTSRPIAGGGNRGSHQREIRGAAPITPLMPTPGGPLPLPPLPPPKTTGGGGGGGGAAKSEPVSPVPGAPYTYGGFGELNWDALAEAESGGNWSMNSGNGYYGGLQFDLPTWNEFGGQQFAERPDLASKQEQIKVATALYNKRKGAPWPTNGWLLTASDEQLRNAGLTTTGKPSSRRSGNGGGGGTGPRYGGGASGSGGQLPMVDQFAQSVSGNAYKWGGVGQEGLYDCSGFMSDIYGMLTGKPYQGNERYFTTTSNFEAMGFQPGNMPGAFNVSVTPSHMVGQLPSGVAVEAGGQTGQGATYGGKARSTLPGGKSYYLPESQVPGGYGQYSYDGPGVNRNDPMYVQNAKDSGGAQLGKDIVSGIMEIFGLGDLFKDPTQFGLFKIFKGIMGLRPAEQDNGYGNGSGGGGDLFGGLGGGGGGGGGLIDSLMGFIPQPFGALTEGSPADAPTEFIPGMGGSGGGSAASILGGLVPSAAGMGRGGQQGAGRTVDQSVHMEGAHFGYSQTAVKDQIDRGHLEATRPGLRPLPIK